MLVLQTGHGSGSDCAGGAEVVVGPVGRPARADAFMPPSSRYRVITILNRRTRSQINSDW